MWNISWEQCELSLGKRLSQKNNTILGSKLMMFVEISTTLTPSYLLIYLVN